MSDEERDGEEEHIKRLIKRMEESSKRQIETLMGSMMEQMGPLLMGGQLLGDEAKAWDEYACKSLEGAFENYTIPEDVEADIARDAGALCTIAVAIADTMLAERRKRFGKDKFDEQLRGLLPSGKNLCNAPVIVKGEDSGMRCTRNAGHDGEAHY